MLPARRFGPGSPATGEAVQLRVVGNDLVVQSGVTEHRAPVAMLQLRRIGLDEAGIELRWDSVDGVQAVQVLDAQAARSLCAEPAIAAAPQLDALNAAQRKRALARNIGWIAVATFLLLPVLLSLIFIWQADRIAVAVASRIPFAQEVQLGERAFASLRGELVLQDSGPTYDAVTLLGKRLSQGSVYNYRFHVAQSDVVNAFALPGGIVVVNTGLIAATRQPEELAGVLAHELQHVELRHSLQAMVKELGLRGVWLLATGDIGGTALGSAALQLSSLKFSRDAEAQADARGFDVLVANRIDPRGLIDFFNVMAQQEEGATPPAFLSTHPASENRQQALTLKLRTLNKPHFEPLHTGKWPP